MAIYSEDTIYGINVALNEAKLLGVEFHQDKEAVAVSFAPLAIDENGQLPADNRVLFVFSPVGKFVASYRLGRWDDSTAPTVKFEPKQIFDKIEEFGHRSIYGWEFIDCNRKSESWLDKLSFEYISVDKHGREHSIELFQEGVDKHIDVKIWFDEFEIFTPKYDKVEIQAFIDNGKRAWDGIYYGNASDIFGIYPLKANTILSKSTGENAVNNTGTRFHVKPKHHKFKELWRKLWK